MVFVAALTCLTHSLHTWWRPPVQCRCEQCEFPFWPSCSTLLTGTFTIHRTSLIVSRDPRIPRFRWLLTTGSQGWDMIKTSCEQGDG
jgi:hypothetical protein